MSELKPKREMELRGASGRQGTQRLWDMEKRGPNGRLEDVEKRRLEDVEKREPNGRLEDVEKREPNGRQNAGVLADATRPPGSERLQAEGIHYRTGQRIKVTCERGAIAHIELLEPDGGGSGPLICPGLVDLQINGYRGMDFNTSPLRAETVAAVVRGLWGAGVTSSLPTVITNSDQAIEEAVGAIAKACAADPAVRGSVAGIHLEGPFLSPQDGARGAHDKAYVKAPDWELFERWQAAAEGAIRIVTVSPEWPTSVDFIRRCAESGVIVSIGHTSASPEQIRAAVEAGATMSTHFGNGAHAVLPRHPNYLWEQLAQDELWACLIADGFHLPDAVLKVAMKVKGERAMLVSDAVMFCGMEPGEYRTHIGGSVVLTPEGRLQLADNPQLLAGSAQLLPWGVAHLAKRGLCSLADAWDMASLRPAAKLGLPTQGGLEVDAPADFVLAEWDGQAVRIVETYKSGERVYAGR